MMSLNRAVTAPGSSNRAWWLAAAKAKSTRYNFSFSEVDKPEGRR